MITSDLALLAALLAGVLFVVVSLVRRPAAPAHEETLIAKPEPEVYWPLLLGTGERTFSADVRLRIVQQLGHMRDDWRVPILLCAREQERDPALLAEIERALGAQGQPVIGAPAE